VAQTSFSAAIEAWALKSQRRLEYVVKESAQRVMQQANEGMPVDTGFAQASFRATLNGYSTFTPAIPVAYPGVPFTPPAGTYLEAIFIPNTTLDHSFLTTARWSIAASFRCPFALLLAAASLPRWR